MGLSPFRHYSTINLLTCTLLTLMLAWLVLRTHFAPGLSAEQAYNATYRTAWIPDRQFTLQDGTFHGSPQADGIEANMQVELLYFALGNIDGLAGNDAAVILNLTFGTRSSYYELHVLVERDGEAVHAGSAYLGDRVEIDCLILNRPGLMLRWYTLEAQLGIDGHPGTAETAHFVIDNGQLAYADPT